MYVFFIIMFYCVYGQMSEIKNYYYYYYYNKSHFFKNLINWYVLDYMFREFSLKKLYINI